jgi:GNAT superfamily N-acetyltransferase
VLIRKALRGDADAVARVHVRSWQVGYRGLLGDLYLDGLRPEERGDSYRFDSDDPDDPATIVAVRRDEICGFATTAPARDGDAVGSGELCALYVDPRWWGSGIGRALIAAARARLVDQGFGAAVLWVLVGNDRAERFYVRDGWAPDGSRRVDEVWGATVDERRYQRRLSGRPSAPGVA